MAREVYISPLSSLNFDHAWKLPSQVPVCYAQKFLRSDRICVQYSILTQYQYTIRLYREGAEISTHPSLLTNDGTWSTYALKLQMLPTGHYELIFSLSDLVKVASAEFYVVDSTNDTVLLSYNHHRNQYDTIFTSGEYFDFRIEGVFLPGESTFLVDSEGFRDQRYNYSQLSAFPYRKDILTIGGGFGVPNWAAEKLNYIFSLSNIWIDGDKYVRSEESVPEITQLHIDYPLFLYKMELEKDRKAIYDPIYGDYNNDFNNDFLIGQ